MRTMAIVVSAAALSIGCQQSSLTELREDAQEVVDGARMRADELREMSAEELQDLWAIEYTSIELATADLGELNERLNEMGRERWECYHVSDQAQGQVFYFKRRSSTVTSYLTNLLRLGAVAF